MANLTSAHRFTGQLNGKQAELRHLFLMAVDRTLFNKRTAFGFTYGEATAWLTFHVASAVVLGALYYFAGLFDGERFMTLSKFASIQAYVLTVKAVFILPFWLLFFRYLVKQPLLVILGVHVFTSLLFASLVITTVYFIKTRLHGDEYRVASITGDAYGLLAFYLFHFCLFHAHNFWLRIQRQKQREMELKTLAYESEIMALKSQMEPHFLFNTLNSISATVPPSLEKTRVLVAQLADTFRYVLKASQTEKVSLGEELDFIQNCLALEQQRFQNRLYVQFDIEPTVLDVQLPPMILQPLVENAVKHGIAPSREGGKIFIACNRENGHVNISVTDTGRGYNGTVQELLKRGVGINNINKRLERLYDERLNIVIPKQGFSVKFKIPVN